MAGPCKARPCEGNEVGSAHSGRGERELGRRMQSTESRRFERGAAYRGFHRCECSYAAFERARSHVRLLTGHPCGGDIVTVLPSDSRLISRLDPKQQRLKSDDGRRVGSPSGAVRRTFVVLIVRRVAGAHRVRLHCDGEPNACRGSTVEVERCRLC